MALRAVLELFARVALVNCERLEVGDVRHDAGTVNRALLLRISRVALGGINQLAARAVGKLNLRRDAVGHRQRPLSGPYGLRRDAHRARAKQETKVIKKVAALADDAPAALVLIGVPVAGVELAGEHAVTCRLRAGNKVEPALQLDARRGEAAVEPYLHTLRMLRNRRINFGKLGARKTKRFLYEHMPPRLERGHHHRRVQMVACADQHRAVARLAKRGFGIGRRLGEAKLIADVIRAKRGVVDDRAKRNPALEARQQHRPGEVARADHVELLHRLGQALGRRDVACLGVGLGRRLARRVVRFAVLHHHADVARGAVPERLVHRQRVVEFHAPGGDRAEVEFARAQQMQTGLEVALLGPAHVADRVIRAAPLIRRIVPARAVRARETHVEFLVGKDAPRQLDLRDADIDQAAAVAQRVGALLDRCVAVGADTDHRGVDAVAVGPLANLVLQILRRRNHHPLGTHRGRVLAARLVEVHRHDARAVCLKQAGNQQADQPLPHHQHPIAKARLGLAHRLHRDGEQRRVGRLPHRHLLRHPGHEHVRHGDVLGMERALGAAARHAVADAKTGVAFIHRLDNPGRAVAERRRRREPVAHFFVGGLPADVPRGIDHLANLIRPGFGFLKQIHLGLLDLHFLSADRDDGVCRAHQHPARWRDGARHLLQFQPSVLILGNLFQCAKKLACTTNGVTVK